MARVGLAMSNHNRGEYLQEAIDSVIAQTFTDWELTIWDNASIDNSRSILSQVTDPRITIVYGDYNIFPVCQHTALYGLDCEYLGIVDSDDRMLPDCLKETVTHLDDRADVGMVFTYYAEIDADGKFRRVGLRCWVDYNPSEIPIGHVIFHFKLFRKSCHDAIGGINKDQLLAVDREFTLRFSERFTIERLPMLLYEYRIHPTSVTQSRSEEQNKWCSIASSQSKSRRLNVGFKSIAETNQPIAIDLESKRRTFEAITRRCYGRS